MTHDTTGPTTVNERASFLYLLILLTFTGSAAWLFLEIQALATPKPTAPIAAIAASQPTTRRAGDLAEGVNRINDETVIVKAGDTFIAINHNDTNVWPTRTFSRDNPDAAERWQLANTLNAISRDPNFAERFDAQNVAEKLRAINLRPPRLTPSQYNEIRDLFLAAQDAKGPDRLKADQALHDAVAAMPIPPDEQQAFDANIAKARALLSPAQLDLIRIGGKREPRPTSRPATHPATRPAGQPAPATPSTTQPQG